ncbi:GDP-L-fucose synthase [Persicimonas caeni]|uniref:GDP-L-fucose synthase n=1 Tax=Persicimonas caeni TaxID=2292766 RepID=A0A4Y6Q2X9_PERCE|nr:GDP-L-fucose synthase [Persicimonas caeni]QED36104.1 GDP-L-fucose synthase [Persicimonas caeni]
MTASAKVYVAGHTGLVGSAIVRRLQDAGYEDIVTRRSSELDLTRQADVEAFFAQSFAKQDKPGFVIDAAAKVGGILANNTYRGEFIRDNLLIQTNLIDAARRAGVERLLFLGSSCIYPRECPQPMREDHLLTGPLEPTNEPYAIAKIAGIKMCEAFNAQYGTRYLSVMPTNLYGPGDNFDLETSHVLPAFIHKFHRAKVQGDDEVVMWGTGSPRREFLYVDDLADACVYLLEETDEVELTNIGVGEDISIRELAELVADVVGFEGEIVNDASKPDGTPRKLLDVSKLNGLGWEAKVGLREGVERTYRWFVENWIP